MALYFIRHGESESNERNLFAGRFDTPLTNLGRRQAAKARARVESLDLKFDEVHTTPLSRARDTAKLIVDNAAVPHIEANDLVERDFGLLSEQNKSLIKKYFGAHEFEQMFHSATGAPPEGESFRAMYDRVLNYYKTVLEPQHRAGRTLLIVAHKYIIEMFALIAADLPPESYHDFRIPNCKPLSFEELRRCVGSTSPLLNRISEETEARLAPLLLIATLIGGALRFLVDRPILPAVFSALMLLLLAINSGFSILRLESSVIFDSLSSLKRIWKAFLPRYLLGLGLIIFAKDEMAISIGAFLLLPPAMTSPTLSLAWGGDYFLTSQATLISTLLSPLLMGLGSLLALHATFSGSQFGSYVWALIAAVALPGLLAQMARTKSPIQAGALCTNWGWVGAAVMIPLSALASYQFFPARFELAHFAQRDFIVPVILAAGLFALLRLFAGLSGLLKSLNTRANLDRYITHIAPNIFFWFTLLGETPKWVGLRFTVTLFFFASIYLEEKRIVRKFPRTAKLRPVSLQTYLATETVTEI